MKLLNELQDLLAATMNDDNTNNNDDNNNTNDNDDVTTASTLEVKFSGVRYHAAMTFSLNLLLKRTQKTNCAGLHCTGLDDSSKAALHTTTGTCICQDNTNNTMYTCR